MTGSSLWPPSVPESWTRCKAQYVLLPVSREPLPEDEIVTAFRDGEVTLRRNRREEGFTNAVKEIGYQHISRGDLVVHSMDGGFGAIGVSDSDGKASPVVHAYRSEKCDAHFVAYYLRAAIWSGWIAANGKGIRERSTQFDRPALGRLEIAFPSKAIQRAIVDYLDRETGKIGAMIGKLDDLANVLTARLAGLRAAELAKTSERRGLRWMVSQINTGPFGTQVKQGDYITGGTPLINPSHIVDGRLAPDDRVSLPEPKAAELDRFELRIGDVVVARRGELGRSAVVRDTDIPAICGTGSLRVRPDLSMALPEFVQLVISSPEAIRELEQLSVGATMGNLNERLLGDIHMPVLSIIEQRRMLGRIEEVTEQIDAMQGKVAELKELLTEHRTALITDVVTGKKEVA